jgi:hypothetical protein
MDQEKDQDKLLTRPQLAEFLSERGYSPAPILSSGRAISALRPSDRFGGQENAA